MQTCKFGRHSAVAFPVTVMKAFPKASWLQECAWLMLCLHNVLFHELWLCFEVRTEMCRLQYLGTPACQCHWYNQLSLLVMPDRV